jgi:putative ABC transport system permease protein
MTLAALAIKNVARNKGRTALTVLGIAVAIVLFTLMRTFVASWTGAIEHAAKDRVATRHKVTFVMTLPKKYVEEIRQIPGVTKVTWANWFGAKEPNHPADFFATIATDATSFLEVYDEVEVSPAHAEAWKQNRRGALVGDQLATKFGWKPGDKVVLQGTIFPGMWEFEVSGIYTSQRKSVDRATFWFHWDYLNESPQTRQKDQIGWIVSRIDDAGRSAAVAKAIDARFDDRDIQTLSMSEKAMQQSFLGMFSAILKAVDVVSIAILVIILLVLGNTIAMAVRERTGEYGCLRAIGFQPRHIAIFVTGEALVIGVLGGLLGIGLAHLFINVVVGPALEENMGGMFPYFRIPPEVAVIAVGLATALAGLAAIIPAYRAARLDVVTALRTVE